MAIVLIVLGFDSSVPRARNISHTFHLQTRTNTIYHIQTKPRAVERGVKPGQPPPGPSVPGGPFSQILSYISALNETVY